MPVYRRTVVQGITREETQLVIGNAHSDARRSAREADSDKEALHAFLQQQHQLNSFDGRIGKVEQHCRQILAEEDARRGSALTVKEAMPNGCTFGSQEWYAKRILLSISAARSAQLRGCTSLAMSEAVEVGAWVTEAQAKFSWANLLLGEARSRKNRELGRRGAASVRRKAYERDRDILQAAAGYRRKFRDVTTEHSTRNIRQIARDLAMKEGTVRDRLRKHGKR